MNKKYFTVSFIFVELLVCFGVVSEDELFVLYPIIVTKYGKATP